MFISLSSALKRILSICLIALLIGCNAEEAPSNGTLQLDEETSLPEWLDGQVALTPQEWLVLRSRAPVDEINHDDEVHRTALLLLQVSRRYNESHRMVANRAAQLEDMLFEQGHQETAVELLEWFVNLPPLTTPHSFSALCQYYVTLRAQGQSREQIARYWTKGTA